jgi:hypothetical protein
VDIKSESSDSVIKADQIVSIQPMLAKLNKKLKNDAKHEKERKKAKSNLKVKSKKPKCKKDIYSHIHSKVAESILGRGSVVSYKSMRRTFRPKSEPRVIKNYKTVKPKVKTHFKAKSVKSVRRKRCKKKIKVSKPKKGIKTEIVTDSANSVQPLNIRTEVAVKLFPDNKPIDVSGSVFTKKSRAKSTAKSQSNWIKRNSRPKKPAISEYEKYEEIFVKGRCNRTDLIGHSVKVRYLK